MQTLLSLDVARLQAGAARQPSAIDAAAGPAVQARLSVLRCAAEQIQAASSGGGGSGGGDGGVELARLEGELAAMQQQIQAAMRSQDRQALMRLMQQRSALSAQKEALATPPPAPGAMGGGSGGGGGGGDVRTELCVLEYAIGLRENDQPDMHADEIVL